MVHALDVVFGIGALFALAALVTVVVGIQAARDGIAETMAEAVETTPSPECGNVIRPLAAMAES